MLNGLLMRCREYGDEGYCEAGDLVREPGSMVAGI